ncbi:hypothetical protein EW026_g7264 [Hermanssonia centrifuga]|uniref:Uncharacterized protein n=1 Tax=Hermanssonia centrifuga TaxID=98765 RepID=A0A4S4KCW1_9APHY|nr:hypothetical protein EW026_g7264 [Hermanssonia centrifuga]
MSPLCPVDYSEDPDPPPLNSVCAYIASYTAKSVLPRKPTAYVARVAGVLLFTEYSRTHRLLDQADIAACLTAFIA